MADTLRTFERRVFNLAEAKITRAKDGGDLKFRGRPWVYGQLSEDLGGWQEVIQEGAATRTLARNPDVRFLINHDANLLCARTTSGTLELSEDEQGGLCDAVLANVTWARDLATLMERGDSTQMSFGFWIIADSWAGNLHRVHEFDLDGGDVSAVTFPAFPQTSSELRSAAARHLGRPDANPDVAAALEQLLACQRSKRPLGEANLQSARDVHAFLAEILAADIVDVDTPDAPDAPGERSMSRNSARQRLRELEAIA